MSQFTFIIILESLTLVGVGALVGGVLLAARRAKRELAETKAKLELAKKELARFLTALQSI